MKDRYRKRQMDYSKTNVAVLALQGAFLEHQQMLETLGVRSRLIRNGQDWQDFVAQSREGMASGLVIPGGESTAMMRIIRDLGLYEPIKEAIRGGMAVLGTCAGLIMLDDKHLGTMDIKVRRNAYGRQLGSFNAVHEVKGIGRFPMTFIRAPYIESVGDGVEVLSVLDNHIVAARQGKQLACAFHPELTADTRFHETFLSLCATD